MQHSSATIPSKFHRRNAACVAVQEVATAVASAIAMVSLQCEVPTPEHVSGAGVVCALGAAEAVAVAEVRPRYSRPMSCLHLHVVVS